LHGIKNRNIIHFLSGFAGRNAGDNLGTIINAVPRVKLSFFSGNSLYHNPRVFICKYAHNFSPVLIFTAKTQRSQS
jgi:hypothetical protein